METHNNQLKTKIFIFEWIYHVQRHGHVPGRLHSAKSYSATDFTTLLELMFIALVCLQKLACLLFQSIIKFHLKSCFRFLRKYLTVLCLLDIVANSCSLFYGGCKILCQLGQC